MLLKLGKTISKSPPKIMKLSVVIKHMNMNPVFKNGYMYLYGFKIKFSKLAYIYKLFKFLWHQNSSKKYKESS
jgi:hypothetical protein